LYVAVVARLVVPAGWSSRFGLLGRGGRALVQVGEPTLLAGPLGAGRASGTLWLLVGYLVVVAILLGRWSFARLTLARALRGARLARPSLSALAPTTILEHDALGPLMTGLWRPRIVLPSSLIDAADADTLACVLAHEAAHVARRDQWLMALCQLACAVAWPIVPVWIAAARLRTLIELAADERALAGAAGLQRRRYGEVLLALAEAGPPRFAFVPSFGNGLRGRLRALASHRRWPRAVQLGLVTAVGLMLLTCAAPPETDHREPVAAAPSHAAATQSRPETMVVSQHLGSLDKNLIRGVIREHINEVKTCYEGELKNNPRLGGRVIVAFTIGLDGSVVSSLLHSTTLASPPAENCIVAAVRGWTFPKPDGGLVRVEYPFVLTPAP
jgi:hypothetical protein